jgi:hypothetical protein
MVGRVGVGGVGGGGGGGVAPISGAEPQHHTADILGTTFSLLCLSWWHLILLTAPNGFRPVQAEF